MEAEEGRVEAFGPERVNMEGGKGGKGKRNVIMKWKGDTA